MNGFGIAAVGRNPVAILLQSIFSIALLWVGGFFAFIWVDRAATSGERRAVENCQEAVLAQLKSPGSDVFPESPFQGELALGHLEATNASPTPIDGMPTLTRRIASAHY